MNKVARIVVPVDFSEITPRLVEYAAFMAGQLGATIHFVHVISLYYGDSMFGMRLPRNYASITKPSAGREWIICLMIPGK